ncbi:MAG: hypothetical protein PSV16_14860 [Flavobacterium sp.]|nr:hypothetical protein [Flavobacterium sp.]
MRAYRIRHNEFGKSYFEEGTLPEHFDLNAKRFFLMTAIEDYQRLQHQAPRYQYVVTLKGKLRFTTSDAKSFIVEPGILLIAEDTQGEGHSWELIDGTEWHRIYIVPDQDAPDGFRANDL